MLQGPAFLHVFQIRQSSRTPGAKVTGERGSGHLAHRGVCFSSTGGWFVPLITTTSKQTRYTLLFMALYTRTCRLFQELHPSGHLRLNHVLVDTLLFHPGVYHLLEKFHTSQKQGPCLLLNACRLHLNNASFLHRQHNKKIAVCTQFQWPDRNPLSHGQEFSSEINPSLGVTLLRVGPLRGKQEHSA